MRKCIFFDRDGIINRRLIGDYVKSFDEFEFLSDFFEIYKYFENQDFLRIIITNQQGVGKGLMSEKDLENVHQKMNDEINKVGLRSSGLRPFDDIFSCTALVSENSSRRKPESGMILEAAEKWNINLGKSWMIGDSESDVIAGNSAGCKTIFIGGDIFESCDYIFKDLGEFVLNLNEIDF
jgi:D-glycero-D-manno-heptose 1,7-bisphosphate phosphatase